MVLIHKIDGGLIKSSGKGDYGICNICNKRVDHLLLKDGKPIISKEVIIFEVE